MYTNFSFDQQHVAKYSFLQLIGNAPAKLTVLGLMMVCSNPKHAKHVGNEENPLLSLQQILRPGVAIIVSKMIYYQTLNKKNQQSHVAGHLRPK